MARFVIFPGTSGSYADTADVNLLDADKAHLAQSVGGWVGGGTNFTFTYLPNSGAYGAMSLLREAGGNNCRIQATGLSIAVLAGDIVLSVNVDNQSPGARDFTLQFTHSVDGTQSEIVPTIPVGESRISAVFTVSAGNVTEIRLQPTNADAVDGDLWVCSFQTLAAGTNQAFVPSLRIVGDIDLESKNAVFNPASGAVQWLQTTRAGNGGYGLFINTDGTWGADHGDGTTSRQGIADTTLVAGVTYTLEATMVAGTWTFLLDGLPDGTDVDTVAAAVPSGSALSFGQSTTTIEQFQGDGYTGSVRDGDETGPIVAIFDAEDLGI